MIDSIFALDKAVRYVAIYQKGELKSQARSDLVSASQEESDIYEELLVNPTLLKLTTQRGNIDCGGLDYLLVRYGNFFQFMQSFDDGHVSVCIEPAADVVHLVERIRSVLDE